MAQLDPKKIEEIKQTHLILLSETLAAMRINEKCDVTLVCEEEQFFAHRCVLEAASPYFKAMLSCGLQESMSGTITLNCMEAETLVAILDFIYRGCVGHINTEELLKSVLIASHLVQLEELVQYCGQALALLLSSNNFFELLEIGLKYEQADLQKVLISFWVVNSSKLFDTDKFLALEIAVLKSLLNFVKCKHQCLDEMLNGFLNWLQFDFESREKCVDEFFDCVDAKLVKQQFVQSWLKDKSVMALCKKFAKRVEKLNNAVVMSGSEPPSENILLDVCSWKIKLTYFSQFRNVEVFDPTTKGYTVPRSDMMCCVQQFDLLSMKWLSVQIPESANVFDFKHMYQFGDVIYMLSETHTGSYEIQTNCFRIEKLKQLSPLGDGFAVFNGHIYTNVCKHVFYSHMSSNDWKKASTLSISPNGSVLLASREYLYVIGDNPETSSEFLIQYSSNPFDACSNWGIIRLVKGEIKLEDFFVYNNTLNALIGFGNDYSSANASCRRCSLRQLTFNHSTKKMEIIDHNMPEGFTDQNLKLSRFQDYRSPYIFFASSNDNFSIPFYACQPAAGIWTKLPPRSGKCEIKNDPSVKLGYSVDK